MGKAGRAKRVDTRFALIQFHTFFFFFFAEVLTSRKIIKPIKEQQKAKEEKKKRPATKAAVKRNLKDLPSASKIGRTKMKIASKKKPAKLYFCLVSGAPYEDPT